MLAYVPKHSNPALILGKKKRERCARVLAYVPKQSLTLHQPRSNLALILQKKKGEKCARVLAYALEYA